VRAARLRRAARARIASRAPRRSRSLDATRHAGERTVMETSVDMRSSISAPKMTFASGSTFS
jgi:hypothetical protein